MFSTVEIACQRIVKAKTVEHALRQILPRKIVSDCVLEAQSSSQENCKRGLVEIISEHQGFEPELLLDEVTERLGMKANKSLHLPSPTLLEKVGIGISELRRVIAIPQFCDDSRSGYCLAVADPGLISVADFEARGVKIKLSLSSQISQIWQQYENLAGSSRYEKVEEEAARLALVQLLLLDQQKGGGGVTVGRVNPATYELSSGKQKISGKIHSGVYWALVGMSRGHRTFNFSIEPKFAPSLAPYLLGQALASERVEVRQETLGARVYFECNLRPKGDSQSQVVVETFLLEGVVDREIEIDIEGQPQIQSTSNTVSEGKVDILIVDDDRKFGGLLLDLLARHGYRAVFYSSLQEVRNEFLAKGNECSLIISDVHMLDACTMPPGSELSSVRGVRSLFPNSPVIFLTSDPTVETEVAVIHSGADAYLGKCDEQEVLLSWISNLLARDRGQMRRYV